MINWPANDLHSCGGRSRDMTTDWEVEGEIKKQKQNSSLDLSRFTEKNNLHISPKIVGNIKEAFQAFRREVICVITGDAKLK